MFSVVEVMSTELCTLGPDGSLEDARKMMAKRHIRHILIVQVHAQQFLVAFHHE